MQSVGTEKEESWSRVDAPDADVDVLLRPMALVMMFFIGWLSASSGRSTLRPPPPDPGVVDGDLLESVVAQTVGAAVAALTTLRTSWSARTATMVVHSGVVLP
jgi:hypothetical protein